MHYKATSVCITSVRHGGGQSRRSDYVLLSLAHEDKVDVHALEFGVSHLRRSPSLARFYSPSVYFSIMRNQTAPQLWVYAAGSQ